MKRFTKYIKENVTDRLTGDNINLKKDLLDMISDSVNSEDTDVIIPFLDSYIEEDSETVIENLVNDSDIYEFYLKHIEDIDDTLNKMDFFNKTPKSLNIIGIYDYLVYATKEAIFENIKQIREVI